jgi:hypothetical protein
VAVVRFVCLIVLCLAAGSVRAADTCVPPPPTDLPRYDLKLQLDTINHTANLTAHVTWTNRSTKPTNELVFNLYPHYRIPEGDYLLLAKTLELLRLNPSYGIDRAGKHGEVTSVVLTSSRGKTAPDRRKLEYSYRHDNATAIVVTLPEAIGPGERVSVELECNYRLPNKQGRWGHWQGVTAFANAVPVVAYYDDAGWHAMPFVPWHQPFWNEAGVYTTSVFVPVDQKVACSAEVKDERPDSVGWKEVRYEPFVGRDFAVLASADYREYTLPLKVPDGRTIQLKCMAFERHEHYANEMLKIIAEAIPTFSQWFGPFPYSQFTIAESFFGWNGNECGGLVMIDERVFGMPHLGRGYVEYLVSHETCHQWWYNLVGTNGFAETFMDEGAATHFTHRLLDKKHGKNNAILDWPEEVKWLPNIHRENYRNASMMGAIRRGEMTPAAGELPGFNHLVGLFTGAYDRGSKVYGMIEARLGEAAFLEFTRSIVSKYSWGVLTAATFKSELETFTGRPWDDFFEKWVYGKGTTDWQLESVTRPSRTRVRDWRNPFAVNQISVDTKSLMTHEVVIRQKGENFEPTSLGFRFSDSSDYSLRIPISGADSTQKWSESKSDSVSSKVGDWDVESLGDGRWKVTVVLPDFPTQVRIDPDNVILDSNPANNSWKTEPRVSITPVYSMLNETDLTNDYDRWNIGAGPWIGGALYPDPWYTRSSMAGIRAAVYRTQIFAGGVYAAVRSEYRDAVIGADGLLDHEPLRKTQLGFNVERRIGGPWWSTDGYDSAMRASLFSRYVFQYGSSLYLPPIHYAEAFTTYQDNFLPKARSDYDIGDRPGHSWLTGLHYRLNLLTPYWDPEWGVWADAVYAGGVTNLPNDAGKYSSVTAHQMRAELAAVKAFPDCLPFIGSSRLAFRGVFQGALPDRGQFFALGGGTLFRGFDLAERQGSMLWVANAELRLPLAREVEWDALDRTAGVRNVWLAAFYDVGAIYVNGHRNGNVAHALGIGIRVDTAIFSFIERATLRIDVAKTLNANSPVQVWFGVQHPF